MFLKFKRCTTFFSFKQTLLQIIFETIKKSLNLCQKNVQLIVQKKFFLLSSVRIENLNTNFRTKKSLEQ